MVMVEHHLCLFWNLYEI